MATDIYKFSIYCSEILGTTNPGEDDPEMQGRQMQGRRINRGVLEGAMTYSRMLAAYYYAVNFADGMNIADSFHRGMEIANSLMLMPGSTDTDSVKHVITRLFELDKRQFVRNPGIIGWMYMYFNQRKKTDAYNGLRNNIKISGETIAAATQIFTPGWITRYLTENSVHRISGTKSIGFKNIADNRIATSPHLSSPEYRTDCFLPDADPWLDLAVTDPLEIKLLDPCMGCGHMLLGAFDSLMQVYISKGVGAAEASERILSRNLYGLDVDDIAVELGKFALLMKAAEYNHGIIENRPVMNMYGTDHVCTSPGNYGSSELGSLIDPGAGCGVLAGDYDIIATNPPYMGHHNMSPTLSSYVRAKYPLSKTDLSTVFMERAFELCKPGGIISMINIQAWMFLPSYEKFREFLVMNKTLLSMIDLGLGAFGAGLPPTVAFCMVNSLKPGYISTFVDLCDVKTSEKESQLHKSNRRYHRDISSFLRIPQKIFTYSTDAHTLDIMTNTKRLRDYGTPRQGLKTGDNARFIRFWHEVPRDDICFDAKSREDAANSGKKWFPYNKAGGYRKWYGNNRYVVNWENDGEEIRGFKYPDGRQRSRPQNMNYFFKECCSWNMISNRMSARLVPEGYIFDGAGGVIFSGHTDHADNTCHTRYLLGFLNSKAAERFLRETSRSFNFNVGQIADLPLILSESRYMEVVDIVKDCVRLAHWEWDLSEASWDYSAHPIILSEGGMLIGSEQTNNTRSLYSLRDLITAHDKQRCENSVLLRENERRLDMVFSEIYGFPADIIDKTPQKTQAGNARNGLAAVEIVKELVSYAIGCMFGRYHCKGFRSTKRNALSFSDVSKLFKTFLSAEFGHKNLTENLIFIASSLSRNKNLLPEEIFYEYLRKNFMADHEKVYLSRPVYITQGDGFILKQLCR